MGFDNVYEAITEDVGDLRWAYGTGFVDPLAGIDVSVPHGVDGADLAAYCLMLGDDALIMSHRLQLWAARAPELEEETALANIALDLLGQARLLLTRAGHADGSGRDEDSFAFDRNVSQFRNVTLAEAIDDDFGALQVRLLVFATWRLALFDRLTQSRDPVLAAIAAKAVKELTYHRDYAALWVIRLGDGTQRSLARIRAAFEAIEPLIDELFNASEVERRLVAGAVACDPAEARADFDTVLAQVWTAATLGEWRSDLGGGPSRVEAAAGREGRHTDAMTSLLTELQSVARAHPGATW